MPWIAHSTWQRNMGGLAVDELYLRYLSLHTGALDLPSMIAFLVVGLIYFLAPTAGYVASRRGALLGALWVLVGKIGLGLLRTAAIFLLVLDRPGSSPFGAGGDGLQEVLMLFTLVELLAFTFAMVLFVIGLAGLRRREDLPPEGRRQYLDE
jgi:hypothetical protein